MKVKNVIVIGSGKIAAACIGILAGQKLAMTVVETEQQPLSCVRLISGNLRLPYQSVADYAQITKYLRSIRKNTLIVSANNNYLFPGEVLNKRNLCIVNFHNALLPAYPGRNAPTWVIFEGEDLTGITWHIVAEGVDTGEILSQRVIQVGNDVTALELTRLCMEEGINAFEAICPSLVQGNFSTQQQDTSKRKNYHRSWEVPNQGVVDLTWPLPQIHRLLRSLDYGRVPVMPPPRVHWAGKTYIIRKYQLTNALSGQHGMIFRPGQLILQDGEKRLIMEMERRMDHEPSRINFAGNETRARLAAN